MTIVLFVLGLVSLIVGAEFLKAVDHFGLKWGISPLIMGLTVVAFATGAPELAISIKAAMSGSADLVLGNIIGSNIANIAHIRNNRPHCSAKHHPARCKCRRPHSDCGKRLSVCAGT